MVVQCDGIVVVVVSEHDGGEEERLVYVSERLCGVDGWRVVVMGLFTVRLKAAER